MSRSRNIFTSSTILTAWYHFTRRDRFCDDCISPATTVRRTEIDLHIKCPMFPPKFNIIWNLSTNFYESPRISDLREILPAWFARFPYVQFPYWNACLSAVHITYWSGSFSSSKILPCCINCIKLFSKGTQINRTFPRLYLFLNPSLATRRIITVWLKIRKLSPTLPISFVSLLLLSPIQLLCLGVFWVWVRLLEHVELQHCVSVL